jgi:hypothetical protein
MAYWSNPLGNQQENAINYSGAEFQDPLGLGYSSAFQDWQPSEEIPTTGPSFERSPNPSFDLDLHSLPGNEPRSETTTVPNSISDGGEPFQPKIERVLHIIVS